MRVKRRMRRERRVELHTSGIRSAEGKKEGALSRTWLEMANKEQYATKTVANEDDGDAILVGRGTLIARTEEPIEDVTTTRRF